jgi:hypothetical protein
MPKRRKMLINIKDKEPGGYRCSQCAWKFVVDTARVSEAKQELQDLAIKQFDQHICSDFKSDHSIH